MFGPTRYIEWALQFYGQVPFDLASSGMPAAAWSELGVPAPDIGDVGAYQALPAAIARHTMRPAHEVVPALGTSHAIFLAYAAIGSAGDAILVETPGYEPLTRTAEGLGLEVQTFPRLESEGFAIDPDRVAARMTPRTRAIVVTTLHNPTGVGLADDVVRELARVAAAQGAYVIVDEVYAPLCDLRDDGLFEASARRLAPNVIAVSSLTKCWGLGNHRIGWLLGPEPIVEAARTASIATFGHLPLSHAAHAIAAFGALGKLGQRSKNLMAGKRELATTWAASVKGARWSAPGAGLFGMLTLPGRGDLRPRIEELARSSGVLVGAGSFFGAPESFRLSWASCDTATFTKGLELLAPLCA